MASTVLVNKGGISLLQTVCVPLIVPPVIVLTLTSLGLVKAKHFSFPNGSIWLIFLLNQVEVPRFAGGSYPAVVIPGISVNGPKTEDVDLCH